MCPKKRCGANSSIWPRKTGSVWRDGTADGFVHWPNGGSETSWWNRRGRAQEKRIGRLGGFADLNRVVAGLENNFWSARRTVFAFQVRVALVRARCFQAASRKFRIDIAGTAIGLDVEAG